MREVIDFGRWIRRIIVVPAISNVTAHSQTLRSDTASSRDDESGMTGPSASGGIRRFEDPVHVTERCAPSHGHSVHVQARYLATAGSSESVSATIMRAKCGRPQCNRDQSSSTEPRSPRSRPVHLVDRSRVEIATRIIETAQNKLRIIEFCVK